MSLTDAFLNDPAPAGGIWISYREDGIRGSGLASDPYNGSTPESFDAIMASLPASGEIRVNLGLTTADKPFKTRGFWFPLEGTPTGAWQPRQKMTIAGSGIDVTYLQLVIPQLVPDTHYFAIGSNSRTDLLEILDLTIDANLPADTAIACGAIRVSGDHVRVRRVKCVNWGSSTTEQPGFVIALLIHGADPVPPGPLPTDKAQDARIDDCIAVNPSANTLTNAAVNVLHIGGPEQPEQAVEDPPKPALRLPGYGSQIQNCIVDCGSLGTEENPNLALTYEIRALSMGGCLGGLVQGNQIHSVKIGGPYQEVLHTREIIVRGNVYRNVVMGPYWRLGLLSPNILPAATEAHITVAGGVATVTMPALPPPHDDQHHHHHLLAGDYVELDADDSAFDGIQQIIKVPTVNQDDSHPIPQIHQFTFATSASGSDVPVTSIKKVIGVDKLLVEGNHIELVDASTSPTPIAIQLDDRNLFPAPPPYVYGQATIRNNHIRYVDGAVGNFNGYGIHVRGARAAIILDNYIETVPTGVEPIQAERCGNVSWLNNRHPDGTLLAQLLDPVTGTRIAELDAAAEDALTATSFEKP